MTPDADEERRLRERIQALLAEAPSPDPRCLEAGLEQARARARRARRARRVMVWAGAALLAASAAASIGWWTTANGPPTGQPEAPAGADKPSGAESGSDGTDTGAQRESGSGSRRGVESGDSAVIYRRAQ